MMGGGVINAKVTQQPFGRRV